MSYEDPDRKISAKTRRANVFRLLNTGGWIPGPLIASPDVGGSEGLRRLRELRSKRHGGWTIEMRKMANSDAFEYRLVL